MRLCNISAVIMTHGLLLTTVVLRVIAGAYIEAQEHILSRTTLSIQENSDDELILAELYYPYNSPQYVVSATGGNGEFEVRGGKLIKSRCTDDTCGKVCTATGCLNAGEVYTIIVTCRGCSDCAKRSDVFKLYVTENKPPRFTVSAMTVWVDGRKSSSGDVVYEIPVTDPEDDHIYYTLQSGLEPSYKKNNILFKLDGPQIVAQKDLSAEYSNYYYMSVCIEDRRSAKVCDVVNITLESCFEIPTCEDKTDLEITNLWGTTQFDTSVIWEMKKNQPSGHFPRFSVNWQNLQWSFSRNEFAGIDIDPKTGKISVLTNITVHPTYPRKSYESTVQVSNKPYSCELSECKVRITVISTDWTFKTRNLLSSVDLSELPTSVRVHEDYDNYFELATFRVDYSYVYYDSYDNQYANNVSCGIDISPSESGLFNIVRTSRHYFELYKNECQNRSCGYKSSKYQCKTGIGCLNHNLTSFYTITITCDDRDRHTGSGTIRVNVTDNAAPVYTDLPTKIYVDSQKTAAHDTLFSILFTDTDDDELHFEYTYKDALGPLYFKCSDTGNQTNNLANVTAIQAFNYEQVNTTYIIEVCGHERRNEICEDLTIELVEYCGPTPACSDSEKTVSDSYSGMLFDISDLVLNKNIFQGLSYAIVSPHMQYFSVDHTFGTVSTNGNLRASYPSSTYIITAFVYAKDACSVGNCILILNVNFTNEPININNLPANISVHEDDTTTETIFVLNVQDDNEDDKITCEISNDESVEPFYLTETFHGSEEYVIRKRADTMLSFAKTNYSITVTCSDAYGSNDTETLTINVELNEGPTLVDLGSPSDLHISPFENSKGAIIHTVTAKDKEGDDLTFNCSVENSMNPLVCTPGYYEVFVTLRRDIDPVLEADAEYEIDICVSDDKHHNSSCGILQVTITTNKTAPEISNLPNSTDVPENISVGSTIFTAEINDPDLGETHTVTVSVYPKSERSTFIISGGKVVLARPLNYETRNEYVLVFSVKDDFLEGLDERTLKLNITNVNEGNVLEVEKSSITFKETKAPNTALDDPGFTCTDEDTDDTLTFSLQTTYDSYFSIDEHNGTITLTKEWDLESGLPTSAILLITCTDQEGLSSTAAVIVNIEEVDEEAPVVNLTKGQLDSPLQLSSNSSLTASLLRFQVTDNDFNGANRIQAKIVGYGLGQKYFRIVRVNNGKRANSEVVEFDLKLKNYIDFDNNKNFTFTIVATAGGELDTGLEGTAQCYVDPPAVKTKESKRCLTCTKNGKAVIACLVVELALIVGFIVHAACAMSCKMKGPSLQAPNEGKHEQRLQKNSVLHSTQRDKDFPPKKHVAFETNTGSRSRPVSLKSVLVSSSSVDLSSGSSDDSDFDDEEFLKGDMSVSCKGSLTTNRVRPFSLQTLPTGNKQFHLDYDGFPPPVFSSRLSSVSSRVDPSRSGPLPRSLDFDGFPPPVFSNRLSSVTGRVDPSISGPLPRPVYSSSVSSTTAF